MTRVEEKVWILRQNFKTKYNIAPNTVIMHYSLLDDLKANAAVFSRDYRYHKEGEPLRIFGMEIVETDKPDYLSVGFQTKI